MEAEFVMDLELTHPQLKGKAQGGIFAQYCMSLNAALKSSDWEKITFLSETLLECWQTDRRIFICGNGGSAANAAHIANDLLYGISKKLGTGLKVQALSANPAVLTCLANDEGYDNIFSHQLAVQANKNDVLVVLSSSGNSPNILKVLEEAKRIGVLSFAILGYSGGKAHPLTDVPITYAVNDVQISEDLQVIIFHMVMQWLYQAAKLL